MRRFYAVAAAVCLCASLCLLHQDVSAEGVNIKEPSGENFFSYLSKSDDFKPVKKEKEFLTGKWNKWLIFPWSYKWPTITEELIREMKEAGFNGGEVQRSGVQKAKIFQDLGFLFYVGHTTGKGELKLRSHNAKSKVRAQLNRPVCLLKKETWDEMTKTIKHVNKHIKKFKNRVAYALGDEISWSSFTSPCKWDNSPESIEGFNKWLIERYGSKENVLAQWGNGKEKFMKRMANLDDLQGFYKKNFREWNLSPWMDAISYMDSQFNNIVGKLVNFTNELDPETPCGFVGGHAPAAYGGSNYVKTMPKVQFLESYDIGCSMEIIRSFNTDNIPVVQTSFTHPDKPAGLWFYWFYLAHGNRGVIPWAEGWFKNEEDKKIRLSYGAYVQQLEAVSKKTFDAEWLHDGIAVYYSHPSIQISFFMDCELHKKTWVHRGSSLSNKLCSMIATHWAWTKFLEDSRMQYDFISYRDTVLRGIDPKKYPVLVLPAVFGMSNAEAEAIRIYVKNGGTIIADHQTGLFDHHGKGREKGALDDVFGIKERKPAGPGRLFGGKALAEFNPEKYWKNDFLKAANDIRPACKRAKGLIVAERDLNTFIENTYGKGKAILLNVSLVEYLNKRKENYSEARKTVQPVLKYFTDAGIKPRVALSIDGKEPHITEATYWKHNGRMYIYVVKNPLRFGSITGQGKTEGVAREEKDLKIMFNKPMTDIIDERTGKKYGETVSITIKWKCDESVVISCKI